MSRQFRTREKIGHPSEAVHVKEFWIFFLLLTLCHLRRECVKQLLTGGALHLIMESIYFVNFSSFICEMEHDFFRY